MENACADEMNLRQIVFAEFAGVAALRQKFCEHKMAEMQPSARVGFVRCCPSAGSVWEGTPSLFYFCVALFFALLLPPTKPKRKGGVSPTFA